jgi:hypothetical protein
MRTDPPRFPTRAALPALLSILFLAPAAALAQEPEAGSPAAEVSPERAELRDRIEQVYEVLPLQDGVLLRPRAEFRGVRTLEITDSTLAINGEVVTREEARGWLGERAEAVLRLIELPPAERRVLLGFERGEAGAGRLEAPAAPEPPAAPEEPEEPEEPWDRREYRVRRGGQTVVGSHVHVAEDEVVDEVTVFGGSATIDGKVDGEVVVLGGSLRINGEVERDATVIGGSIRLGPDAVVGGDATAVGGSVHREPGARVDGRIEEARSGWGGPWWLDGPDREWRIGWSPWGGVVELLVFVTALVLFGLLMAVVIALGRERIERVAARAGSEPIKAGVVGLLVTVLALPVFVVVMVLLCLTIIGIPIAVALALALPFLMILWVVLALAGYTAVSLGVGRWFARRFDRSVESPYAASFLGLFVLALLLLIGNLLDVFGGPVAVFAAMFALAGLLVQFVAWNVGFGAVFLDIYARRAERRAARFQPPAPPPVVPPAEPAPPPEVPPSP